MGRHFFCPDFQYIEGSFSPKDRALAPRLAVHRRCCPSRSPVTSPAWSGSRPASRSPSTPAGSAVPLWASHFPPWVWAPSSHGLPADGRLYPGGGEVFRMTVVFRSHPSAYLPPLGFCGHPRCEPLLQTICLNSSSHCEGRTRGI